MVDGEGDNDGDGLADSDGDGDDDSDADSDDGVCGQGNESSTRAAHGTSTTWLVFLETLTTT